MAAGFGKLEYAATRIMSWASTRRTTRVEDATYSLMGLFQINMPLLYGEGPNAFMRLQLEIMKKFHDDSLLAWDIPSENRRIGGYEAFNRSLDVPDGYWWGGLLAPSVQCFKSCTDHCLTLYGLNNGMSLSMTNRGFRVKGRVRQISKDHHGFARWLLPLRCSTSRWDSDRDCFGIVLRSNADLEDSLFAHRADDAQGLPGDLVNYDCETERRRSDYKGRKIIVPQHWPTDFD